MKAITVHQPEAELIKLRRKPVEFRSWATTYRGPIAIHSSMSLERFRDGYAGWYLGTHPALPEPKLQRGAIIASARLTECARLVAYPPEEGPFALIDLLSKMHYFTGDGRHLSLGTASSLVAPVGDFAWLLEDVMSVQERCPACWGAEDPVFGWVCPVCKGANKCEPIPIRGHQRIWNWEPAA